MIPIRAVEEVGLSASKLLALRVTSYMQVINALGSQQCQVMEGPTVVKQAFAPPRLQTFAKQLLLIYDAGKGATADIAPQQFNMLQTTLQQRQGKAIGFKELRDHWSIESFQNHENCLKYNGNEYKLRKDSMLAKLQTAKADAFQDGVQCRLDFESRPRYERFRGQAPSNDRRSSNEAGRHE
jgi:hypothetical protein